MRLHLRSVSTTCLVCIVGSASGHHGDAGRYNETVTTVTGTVVEFQFINPHSLLTIAVEDENGDIVEWQGELGPPNSLENRWVGTKRGFRRETSLP